MRSLTPRERVLGSLVFTTIAGAVLFESAIQPQLTRNTELRHRVNQSQVSLTQMRANLQLKDQIEARYEELKGLIRESGSPSQEMAGFAEALTGMYLPLKVQTKSVRPLPDIDEGFYRKFTLRVEMEGSVPEIAKFMAAMTDFPAPIRVERLDITCKERPDYVTAMFVITKIVTKKATGIKQQAKNAGLVRAKASEATTEH